MHVTVDENAKSRNARSAETVYSFGFSGTTYDQFREYEKMYPPIPLGETMRLLRLAQAGDAVATELLIKHNSRKIMLFAIQAHTGRRRTGRPVLWSAYRAHQVPLDECLSIAASGMWEAIMRYDETRWSPVAGEPVRFSSWANLIITQRLSTAISREMQHNVRFKPEEDGTLNAAGDGREFVPRQIEPDPELEVARDTFWEFVEETCGADGRRALEEWQCKLTRERRREIYEDYARALRCLKEAADQSTLGSLRRKLSM